MNIPQKSSSQLDQNASITCFNPAFFKSGFCTKNAEILNIIYLLVRFLEIEMAGAETVNTKKKDNFNYTKQG